jgi:hypothetical protein
MPRITLRLDERHVDLLEEREAEDDTNRSAAARAILDEYEERMNSSHDEYEDVHTPECEELIQRVSDVEARLAELEPEGGAAATSASAGRPSPDETAPPLEDVGNTGEEPNAVSDRESAETSEPVDSVEIDWQSDEGELHARVTDWIDEHPPRKQHGKRALLAVWSALREREVAATAELKAAGMDAAGDAYESEKSLWESLGRYLEDVPGVEKGGYGEWEYAGDDIAREELEE